MHRQVDAGEDAAVVLAARESLTLVRLTSSTSPVLEGEPFALAAQVQALGGAGPAATGSVQFRVGTRVLGRAALDDDGRAVLDGVLLPAGVHALTATYGGDPRHAAATSPPLPQAVTAAARPVVLLVAAPTDVAGGVMLVAELLDPRTGRLAEDATGTLVFSAGTQTLATVELTSGHARAVVAQQPAGTLEARYAGDAEHAAAFGACTATAARR